MTVLMKRAANRAGAALALGAIGILLASRTSSGPSGSDSGDEAILHLRKWQLL